MTTSLLYRSLHFSHRNHHLYQCPKTAFRSIATKPSEEWLQLLDDASTLSRSLYRRCFRSIRHIRHGNDHDEEEFQRREKDRLSNLDEDRSDPRLSMLSMLPPVDRVDELRSRAEYYQQYTRENFVQESDCLEHEDLLEGHIDRFVYLLRRGDDHRKWLLTDMRFDDPCKQEELLNASNQINDFETRARSMVLKRKGNAAGQAAKAEDKNFWDDEEDDDDDDDDKSQGLPEWYSNPRR
jgi:hypothetical protein